MFTIVAGGVVPAAVEVECVVPGGGWGGCGRWGVGVWVWGGGVNWGEFAVIRIAGGGGQRQVAIGLIEEAGAALAFEIIDDIGKGRFFEHVGADDKGPGGGGMAWPEGPQPVGAGCGAGGKVDGPELPVFPFVDGAAVRDLAAVDRLAGAVVDQLEESKGKVAGGYHYGAFGLIAFVAYLVGEDTKGLGLKGSRQ